MPCEREECDSLKELKEAHKELELKVDNGFKTHETRLGKGEVEFAVIKTKLNAILWGLMAIGGAIASVAVKVLFFP